MFVEIVTKHFFLKKKTFHVFLGIRGLASSTFMALISFLQDLIGREVIQQKREAENTLGFMPLTITGKIKVFDV